jgi:kynurenine formamidase
MVPTSKLEFKREIMIAGSPDLLPKLIRTIQQGATKIIDLSYSLDEHSPFWPDQSGECPFHATTVATREHDGYFVRTLQLPEHFGTHLDAPRHFDPRGKSVDELAVQDLMLQSAVVDVRVAVGADPDYRLSVQDLQQWENAYGPLPSGGAVLILTGWGARWPSQERYLNQDPNGAKHFPGFSVEAAQYLLDIARPKAIGIDTISIDYGLSQKFEVHELTMYAGLYHLESLANLEQLPAKGALLIALPMKLCGGSGCPTRVLALLP